MERPLLGISGIRLKSRLGRNPVAAPGRTQGLLAIMNPDEDDGFVAAQDDD